MLDRTNRHLIQLLLCTLLASANVSLADNDRWYRVELMVFAHSGGQNAEKWDPTPALSYPATTRFLRRAGQPLPAVEPLPQGAANDAITQTATSDELGAPLQGAAPLEPLLPDPFVLLADTEKEFRGKAAYMQRSGRYRILFHETWVQPVTGRSTALPIVLDQPAYAGQWPELQGTIQLYVARYLHLKTNLWLNTSGDYFPASWRMPPPPRGPFSAVDDPQESDLDTAAGEETWDQTEGTQPWETQDSKEPEALGPVYPYRHAILLQQKRRMRSSELHYLDHPMLGVVIKLTPLTALDLESLARGETVSKAP